jgi:hypothetical protein
LAVYAIQYESMEAASPSQSTVPVLRRAGMRGIVSFCGALLAGGWLRWWLLAKFFEVSVDSQLYGSMAKHLLLRGCYGLMDAHQVLQPTLIRLPGYPLFLAVCFRLFGMENYYSAAVIQIVLDLAGCFLLALAADRLAPARYRAAAVHATLWLAALCPFTAIYAGQPLTETPTVFCIALALWAVAGFRHLQDWTSALLFTLAATWAALLRPDGALVAVALAPALVWCIRSSWPRHARKLVVCILIAMTPFAAWTIRNARVFHVFQPLAPRYATDPGEDTWRGWQRWMKTWSLDYVSTFQIYWNMPGAPLAITDLPSRAFDSAAQRAETAKLLADYDANEDEMSPALDARFAQLAAERIADHPLRYYLWLPLGRMADMWLRPRVENLNIDLDWWVYAHHNSETRFSWFYAGLNAFYLLLALVGLWLRPRLWPWMLLYFVLRSLLLCTLEAPEARYTIECFPMVFVLGGVAIGRLFAPRSVES